MALRLLITMGLLFVHFTPAHAAGIEDANAAVLELNRGNTEGAILLTTEALKSDKLSKRDEATVYTVRGAAFHRHGEYNAAIDNYNEALKIQADYAVALNNRALANHQLGKDDLAFHDYDTAIQIATASAISYFGRGEVKFDLGHFEEAAKDFSDSLEVNPSRIYTVLWLYLARAKAGKPITDQLLKYSSRLDNAPWPRPVVGLYLGQLSPEAVRAAARTGEGREPHDHDCEATFYLAEYQILRNEKDLALEMLKNSVNSCPKDFYEFYSAKVELSRLQ
jgi:lipoprotein NlpI